MVSVIHTKAPVEKLVQVRKAFLVAAMQKTHMPEEMAWDAVVELGNGMGTRAWGRREMRQVARFPPKLVWAEAEMPMMDLPKAPSTPRVIQKTKGAEESMMPVRVDALARARFIYETSMVPRSGGVVVMPGEGQVVERARGELGLLAEGPEGLERGGLGAVIQGLLEELFGTTMQKSADECEG